MPRYAIGEREPTIDPTAFVHPDAVVIGDVTIGPEATVWPGAVLRGDHGRIRVGARTSIQDGTVVHCTSTLDTVVGDRCVVGHRVHLEGCTIEDDCLIGSGSVVLHRAVVRRGALVGAQALVTNGTEVPSMALALGVPARIHPNKLQPGAHDDAVAVYVGNAHWYNAELRRLD
jgi:carbonic anhydrase/acetyltransferase-like protein (isoleucine patch superfamily)